jgi:hypothetical protein
MTTEALSSYRVSNHEDRHNRHSRDEGYSISNIVLQPEVNPTLAMQ